MPENVIMLEVDKLISDSPSAVHVDEDALKPLVDSIMEHGVVIPIVVVEDGEKYRIITGARRWLAAKEAGIKEIPAIIKLLERVGKA